MKLKAILIGAVASALAMTAGTSMAADYGKQELTVIGSWGFLDHWKEREGPFWKEQIPEATGGALTANAKSLTELGASGFEVMRMLQLGAADVVFAVATYVSQDSPELEGADLPGLVSDLATYRKVIEAYRPIIERELNEKYNGKLMVIYAWPSQELWCNLGDKSKTDVMLSELEGKKIRTYSVPLGDFIEGIGGTAVTIAFGEVVPSLQRGVADCGITGTMPAYNAKWWQVVTHNIQVKLGYAASFMAITTTPGTASPRTRRRSCWKSRPGSRRTSGPPRPTWKMSPFAATPTGRASSDRPATWCRSSRRPRTRRGSSRSSTTWSGRAGRSGAAPRSASTNGTTPSARWPESSSRSEPFLILSPIYDRKGRAPVGARPFRGSRGVAIHV